MTVTCCLHACVLSCATLCTYVVAGGQAHAFQPCRLCFCLADINRAHSAKQEAQKLLHSLWALLVCWAGCPAGFCVGACQQAVHVAATAHCSGCALLLLSCSLVLDALPAAGTQPIRFSAPHSTLGIRAYCEGSIHWPGLLMRATDSWGPDWLLQDVGRAVAI